MAKISRQTLHNWRVGNKVPTQSKLVEAVRNGQLGLQPFIKIRKDYLEQQLEEIKEIEKIAK